MGNDILFLKENLRCWPDPAPILHRGRPPAPSPGSHGGSRHPRALLCPFLPARSFVPGPGEQAGSPCGQRGPAPCEGGDVQGWMSRDGERRAVPAPTCSAGLAQGGGTTLALPTKPNRPGEGRRREETDPQTQAPRKAPLLACQAGLYHEAWMCGESHSSAHALQQLPAPTGNPGPAPAQPAHGSRTQHQPPPHAHKLARGETTGLGKGPGPAQPRPEPSAAGERRDGWYRLRGERLEGPRASAPSPKPPAAGDGGGCPHPSSRPRRGILTRSAG